MSYTIQFFDKYEKGMIHIGDSVKLMFETPKPSRESMFVMVKGMYQNIFIGTLDNDPSTFPESILKSGDFVFFMRQNISS